MSSTPNNRGKAFRHNRFSMYLAPPNASGPMHIGNALMIAIQDVLARYYRNKGSEVLWIPGIDHGGYETQVTFERELENRGLSRDNFTNKEFLSEIVEFVTINVRIIVRQIQEMGASVDWSHFRYTLDANSLAFVRRMFKKMCEDNLIYRSSYMVNYCAECSTMLADIELKERSDIEPLYFIKFPIFGDNDYLTFSTTQPETLYAVTHVLVHPQDKKFSKYIGMSLINPVTGNDVMVVESKRKFNSQDINNFLLLFSPSSSKYDFEYAIRHNLPSQNLFDWEGKMLGRYVGLTAEEARAQVVSFLEEQNAIAELQTQHKSINYLCKKGHVVKNIIRMTWFLSIDNETTPLRQKALNALQKEHIVFQPAWRKKGLVEWIGKMHDWPIARQNVWGIPIPIWYEINDPSLITVWFRDKESVLTKGNLQTLLTTGIEFEHIASNLERIYAAEGVPWTLIREPGKRYLPETDTFDTWFSSGAWSAIIFDEDSSPGINSFYPVDVVVTGYDLVRLFIARLILFSVYIQGKLPFRHVLLHQLIQSFDGQKMSKSLGNSVTLDTYLEKYGADVTRMALISYTNLQQDFTLSDERIEFFREFEDRIRAIGRMCETLTSVARVSTIDANTYKDKNLIVLTNTVCTAAGEKIERYSLAEAQGLLVDFIVNFEERTQAILEQNDADEAGVEFYKAFALYIEALNPFMPFLTEELNLKLFNSTK